MGVNNPHPDRSLAAVAVVFALLGWGLLIREAISAGEQYDGKRAFKGHARDVATELLRLDPDNETARAALAAVERDVDPMEER